MRLAQVSSSQDPVQFDSVGDAVHMAFIYGSLPAMRVDALLETTMCLIGTQPGPLPSNNVYISNPTSIPHVATLPHHGLWVLVPQTVTHTAPTKLDDKVTPL